MKPPENLPGIDLFDHADELANLLADTAFAARQLRSITRMDRGALTDEERNNVRISAHDLVTSIRALAVAAEALKEEANKL
jgi:hypothetical protein